MNKRYVAPSSKTVEVFTTTGILATSNIEMGGDTDEFDTQHLRPGTAGTTLLSKKITLTNKNHKI